MVAAAGADCDPLPASARRAALTCPRAGNKVEWMNHTVAGLVTPHLLRVVDLANEAEKGVNVDWHLRGAVDATMRELRDQWNAPALVASYLEGLENVASQAPAHRTAYARALQAAVSTARGPQRN